MTTFVEMYHPALPGIPHVRAAEQAVPEYEGRGWIRVDGSTPAPEVIYLTPGVGDLRYAKLGDIPTPGTATGDGLRAAYVPKWKPSTAYASGEPVLNPSGQIVTANTAFTSGTSYSSSNWTVVPGGGVSSVAGRTGPVVLAAGDVSGLSTVATTGAYTDLSGKPSIPVTQTVQTIWTTSGTLVVDSHNPVDATSAAKTMTLPTGQAEGTRIIVEKVDASANTVTVSGSIRGSAGTEQLVGQFEAMSFLADSSGSWHPGPSHTTKAWLAAQYGRGAIDATASATVKGDGVTSDTVALQALLDSLATGGGTLLVGNHALTATLKPAAGVNIVGRNDAAGFVLPTNAAFAAVTVDGVNRVMLDRFSVTAPAAQTTDGGTAVSIRGTATDITVRDVRATNLHCGFRTDGALGTVAGTVQRIVFQRCHANTTTQYGFRIDDVSGLTIDNCSSNVSGLDGIKLRKKAQFVHVVGGQYSGAAGGDGLDGYAGSEELVIEGSEFFSNWANGITLKTDALSRDDSATYGMPKAMTLLGVRCHDNTGNGLWIGRVGNVDDPTVPLLTRATVLGGSFTGNTNRGIVILARSVTLDGVQCARNQLEGIAVLANSLDVTIIGARVGGNGTRTPGTIDGINVAGQRVQIIGGSSLGVDPDGARSDADLAAATKIQRYGVRYETTGTNGFISGITCMYNATGTVSDNSLSATLVYGSSDNTGDPSIILPNNRRLLARKADGSQLTLGYVTSGGGINFGDALANINMVGAQLTVLGKFAANGVTPPTRAALPAAATDLATAITLLNAVRTTLIAYGFSS